MPGYGWVFGMGDGTANVGFGLLDTRRGDGGDHREVLRRWLDTFPAEDQLGEEHAVTPLRGAGLPMALHRQPAYTPGPAARRRLPPGTVNPFNGEGISYAMETGRMAAETAVDALARPRGSPREAALRRYPDRLRAEYGRHHRLGHGLPRPARAARTSSGSPPRTASSGRRWSNAALRLMGNLTDGRDGDGVDRVDRRADPTGAGGLTMNRVVDITAWNTSRHGRREVTTPARNVIVLTVGCR